jgi:hypothetical protein
MPIRERVRVRLMCEVPLLQSTNYRRIKLKELLYFRVQRSTVNGIRLARKCEVPILQSTNYSRIIIKELLYFRGGVWINYIDFVVF